MAECKPAAASHRFAGRAGGLQVEFGLFGRGSIVLQRADLCHLQLKCRTWGPTRHGLRGPRPSAAWADTIRTCGEGVRSHHALAADALIITGAARMAALRVGGWSARLLPSRRHRGLETRSPCRALYCGYRARSSAPPEVPTPKLGVSHSRSFDQRRCEPAFLTAMASALRCPTRTTRRLPRVTPV
jgi:hypothetical protein